MHKLLIADNAEAFCSALQSELKDEFNICVCHDGEEALALIKSFQPDVMWIDINLCKVDGITVIERAMEFGCHPLILAAGCYFSEYSLAAMERFGVAYMMSKPCKLSAALARIRDIAQWQMTSEITNRSLMLAADDMLMELHFRSKLIGCRYLHEALQSMAMHPGQAITKELYLAIASKFGTSTKCVERVIRAAIRDAWEHRDERIWREYFMPGSDGSISCPTNGAFIIQLAKRLCRKNGMKRLEQDEIGRVG